jgi:hypothetical protein
MTHKAIDQTQLVHDIISMQSDFKVNSPTIVKLNHYEEHDILNCQWLLVAKTTGTEELVASCLDQTWEGVRAA